MSGDETGGRRPSFFGDALRGYRALGRGLLGTLLFVGSIAIASAAVVVPIWLLATSRPRLFTALSTATFGIAIAFLLLVRFRRQAAATGGLWPWIRGHVAPRAGRWLFVVLSLLVLYGAVVLYASGLYAAALPLTILYAVVLGRVAYRAARR